MAETVTRAVFEAEERGVAETTSKLNRLQGAATGTSKAIDGFTRSTTTAADDIAGVERRVDALQKRLAGAPAAWSRYEKSMRAANDGLSAGQLNGERYAATIREIQHELQRVVAPRLDMDAANSGLSTLLGNAQKVTAATRAAAREMLQMAQARQQADAETARGQEMLARETARYAAEVDALRSKYDPAYASAMRLNQEVKELARLEREGIQIAGGYEVALQGIADRYDATAQAARRAADAHALMLRDARQAQDNDNARSGAAANQQRFNSLLGVQGPTGGSARDSAAAFEAEAIAVARLRAELDPLAVAQARLNAEMAQYQAWAARGEITTNELAKATAQANDRFTDAAARAGATGQAVKLTSGQVQNLGYQLNDVATMLAMGASPFAIISSQSGQVVQALGDGPAGVRGSLRAIGDAAKTGAMAAAAAIGPVGFAFAGVTAAAAGFAFLMRDKIPDATETMAAHKTILDQVAQRYEGIREVLDSIGERQTIGIEIDLGASGDDFRKILKDQMKQLERDFIGAGGLLGNAAYGGAASQNIPALPEFEPIRQMVEEFRAELRAGDADVIAFMGRLKDAYETAGDDVDMRKAIQAARGLAQQLFATATALEQNEVAASDAARSMAAFARTYQDAIGDLSKFVPEARSAAAQIEDAYGRAMRSGMGDGDQMVAVFQRNAAIKELSRDAIAEAEAAANRLNNLSLAPDARALAEIRQSYDAQIAEMERVNGAADAIDAKRRERDAEISAATVEITRAEEARRASYELDLQSVTARTAAEKALIAEQRVRIDLVSQGYSAEEAAARAAEAGALSLAESRQQLSEATRQQAEATTRQIEQAQLEYDLVGKSAGEVARLRAEYELLVQAKDAATNAGFDASTVTLTESMRAQAEEIGRLTDATVRLNMSRDQAEQLRLLEAEAGLIYASAEARQVALAVIEAEAELRREGIDLNSEWGRSYVQNARQIAQMEGALDKQTEAFESLRDAAQDFFQSLASGEGIFDSLISAFSKFGADRASQGLDSLFGLLGGGGKGGEAPGSQLAGAIGNLAGALGSRGTGASLGQTYAAPLGAVTRSDLPALGYVPTPTAAMRQSSARLAEGVTTAVSNNLLSSMLGAGKSASHISGLNTQFSTALTNMFEAAPASVQAVTKINSGFRSVARQAEIFEAAVAKYGSEAAARKWAAPPGKSFHNQGLAADLGYGNTAARNWAHENASRFGLKFPMGHEPWHIELASTRGGGGVASSTNSTRALRQAIADGSIDATRRLATGAVPGVGGTSLPYIDGGYAGYGNTGGIPVPTGRPGGAAGVGGLGGFLGKQISQPGSFLGMHHSGVTIGSGLGTAFGGFSQGYSSGSPVSGALGGALAGVGGGPVGMAIGAISGALGGIFGGKSQREQEHRDKAAKWEEMRPQYEAFDRSLSDEGTGQLREWITTQAAQLNKFMEVAGEAWKYGKGGTSADFQATGTKMFDRFGEMMQEFRDQFLPTIEDLMRGDGMNGAFAQARAAVKNLDKQIDGFLDDVAIAFGSEDLGIATSAEFRAAAEESKAYREQQIALAKRAAGEYALSLLYTANVTSEVQRTLDGFAGTAKGLTKILLDLGWEADAAAAAIDERLKLALGEISKTFVEGFEAQIRDLEGRGYENDLTTLVKDRDTALGDAALLGVDPAIVTKWFTLAAQSVVDGAELTGEAFDALIVAFPQLAGVVTAFTGAVEAATDLQERAASAVERAAADRAEAEANLRAAYERTKSEIEAVIERQKRYQETLRDFITDMRLGDASPLSGYDQFTESQKAFRELQAKALAGDEDAQDKLLGVSQSYLDEARSYYASSEAYYAAFREVEDVLKAADAKAGLQISASQRELEALTKQVSSLISIDTGVQSVAAAIKDLNIAVLALAKAQSELDATRDYGANPDRNRAIVSALRGAGVEYTGGFGGGQFDTWFRSLSSAEQARLRPLIDATAPGGIPAQNFGAAPGRNQAIVSGLAGAGLNYSGGFGNGQFGAWVNSLPAAQRDQANAIASQYAHIGYQRGGIVGNGIYDRDSVLARYASGGYIALAGGEGVIAAPAMRSPGMASFVETANRTRTLPRMAMPAMPQGPLSGGNDNGGVVAELRALRAELRALKSVAAEGARETVAAVQSGNKTAARTLGEQKLRGAKAA